MAGEKVQYEISLNDLFSSKIKNAESSAKSFESSMSNLQGALGKLGIAISGAFAVNKIIEFGRSLVEAGMKVEDATTGLTTLLGDSAEAARVIKNTMEDATKTPFSFEGLLNANQQIIASGVSAEKAREDVLNLANAVAASGKGNVELERMVANLAQISNTGKATAMDIRQFGIAGINIYKVLAEATGKPISEVKDMEISYNMLTMALKRAHEEGGIFYNGLENMSKNTSVKISNLGDTIFTSMVDIFNQLKPLTDFVLSGISNGLANIQNYISGLNLSAFANNLIAGFKAFNDFMAPVYNSIKIHFTTAWESVMKVWNALKQFSSEGGAILTFLRNTLVNLIDAFSWFYNTSVSFLAGLIDVWHTLYVILDKIGVVWLIGKGFNFVWGIIKGIGSSIAWIYTNVIKPTVDGIMYAHEILKKLLGIQSSPSGTKAEKSAIEIGSEIGNNAKQVGKVISSKNTPLMGGTETKGVTGQKVTTINVTIGKLIEQFKIQTTTVGEGTTKIKELVAQTLLSAINDSQIVSGI